ncbi:MAG: Hpt domain-containing protein [Eubacteriales bacterium]|nr:Hpt domain-containing protein [Eubacteriales bacterium]
MEERFADEMKAAGIDFQEGMSRFSDNRELYIKYLYRFCEDEEYDRILLLLQSGKNAEASGHIHSLKGLAASLSLNALRDSCATLQEMVDAGQDVQEELDRFQSVFGQTLGLLLQMLQEEPQ